MTRYRTVEIGVGGSALDALALAAAGNLGHAMNAHRLHLVRVVEPPAGWPSAAPGLHAAGLDSVWDALLEAARHQLTGLAVPDTSLEVSRAVRVGPVAKELTAEAQLTCADLLVVATHDRKGFERAALGSVASALLRCATTPVLVVGKDRPGTGPMARVLAAIDLSPVSRAVLEQAVSIAAAYQGSVQVLSLYETPVLPVLEEKVVASARLRLEALEAEHRAAVERLIAEVPHPGVEVRVEVMAKAPAHNAIVEVAALLSAELLVIGTSGHGMWHRFFLGSTASRVVADARCPVLAVPRVQREEAHEVEPEPAPEEAGAPAPTLDPGLIGPGRAVA